MSLFDSRDKEGRREGGREGSLITETRRDVGMWGGRKRGITDFKGKAVRSLDKKIIFVTAKLKSRKRGTFRFEDVPFGFQTHYH